MRRLLLGPFALIGRRARAGDAGDPPQHTASG
jgi:hypothetical protein